MLEFFRKSPVINLGEVKLQQIKKLNTKQKEMKFKRVNLRNSIE